MEAFHRNSRLLSRIMLAAIVFIPLQMLVAEQVSQLPKPTDYVSDFAHVLSPEAVEKLDRVCAELDHSKANAQIAVVTVRNTDGDDIASWATQLEDKWHMATKGSDRGVLVLLAVDDRKYRIDVAYGLEGILNDARVGDIGRSMVPELRAKDYDGAVVGAVGQVAKVIADDAHITLSDTLPNPPPVHHRQQNGSPAGAILLFLILFLMFGGFGIFRILFWLGLFNSALGGRRYTGGSGPFIGGGGWGGGGGGGDSGGGGFGGFGGGDFGGGGAGGSW
ncbi:TPM domain-containing protein [Occallatibacter savannae]|uniref:TPM domain-containing protein n=1 Tax=Occallatibacter savannae TaxID=1002691 RepID=UPI0013A5334E|nr:TPM domain-containing protein [Occallatibacter savannae]